MRPRLKALLATGYARSAITDGNKLPPGVEIIAKPFEFAALGAMLHATPSRILVVEDETLLRMSLVQDLEALGFEMEEARRRCRPSKTQTAFVAQSSMSACPA